MLRICLTRHINVQINVQLRMSTGEKTIQ